MDALTSKKIDRKYYLAGSVLSGKSTILEALRCFQTFEEWEGRVPPAMYLNDKQLSAQQQKVVDNFLFPQLITKNARMIRPTPGIRIMDRAFLDLFAFSKSRNEVKRKAKELHRRFADRHFQDGHIFFLKASQGALDERIARRGTKKGFDAKTLVAQGHQLAEIYRPHEPSIFDTSVSTVEETAKRIARQILLEKYSEFSFQERLEEIMRNSGEL